MIENSTKPFYGYHALPIFTIISAIVIVTGTVVAIFASRLAGLVMIGVGVYIILSFGISIHFARLRESPNPPEILEIDGDETVLDVGCGLGRIAIGMAKQLKTGKVIGIDIWDKMEIPGNSPERAYANSEIEGVRERVEFKTGNVLSIPFEDNSFDIVTSSSVINNLHSGSEKLVALREIFRVLRPSGRFLLIEPLRNAWGFLTWTTFFAWILLPKNRWVTLLERTGFVNLKYDEVQGIGVFVVEKPSQDWHRPHDHWRTYRRKS